MIKIVKEGFVNKNEIETAIQILDKIPLSWGNIWDTIENLLEILDGKVNGTEWGVFLTHNGWEFYRRCQFGSECLIRCEGEPDQTYLIESSTCGGHWIRLKVEHRWLSDKLNVLDIQTDKDMSLQSWGDNKEGEEATRERVATILSYF